MTELEKLVNEKKGGSRSLASSNGYLSALVEQKKNEQKMATPYADAVKSGAGAQNLYAAVAKKMQGQNTMQTPYADAAAQIKQGNNAAKGTSVVFNSVYGKADDRASSAGSGKYADILKASDYAELSKSGESKRKLFGDARYDYINNIGNFRAQSDVQQAQGRGQDYGKYAFMTDDEIGVYNYLYATQGKKAANSYLSDLEPELDKQWYTGTNRATTEALGKNAATRTLASIATVAAQPTRTVTSMIAMADDAVRTAKGQEINPYSKWRQASNITQDLRADTSQHIEETNPGLGGKVGSFVYNTAMSAADSYMNSLVARGFGEVAGLSGKDLMKATNILGSALMSSEVASLSTAEGKEKGYSNAGAMSLGLTRGAVEFMSEMLGGEWVIKNIKANPLNSVKSMALNMIPEGLEEVMSDAMNGAVNLAVDALFGTEESGIPKMLEYYRNSGTPWQKSHPELATVLAILGQESLSFLGGSLATFGTSAVQTYNMRTSINTTAERLDTTPQNVVQIMQDMETEDPGVIYALAELTDAENADDLRQKIGTKEDMRRAASYLEEQMQAGGRSEKRKGTYTAETQNAPVGAQRAQTAINQTLEANPSDRFAATSPIMGGKGEGGSQNMKGEFGNGQSTYQGRENGASDLRTGGQAAAEGGAQAFTGGRAEIPGGVGQSAQADLRQVTPAQLGIRNGGTEAVTVVDAQKLGGEAKSAYDTVARQGMEPVAVRGAIQVGNGYANAYTESGKVFFRVDAVDSAGNAISPEALVHHELFHNYISEEGLRASAEVIRESMTAEEYDSMYEAYRDAYASIYDFETMSVEEIDRILTEEIAADAYAGLNFFSVDTPVQEAVRAEAERNAPAQRAEAQQQRTGPPGRATAAGINARTAEGLTRGRAMDRAIAMEKSGASNEAIRQETGWYRGMDGQWRFEIDDSGIELYGMYADNWRRIPDRMKLWELIRAQELFEEYPDIQGLPVSFETMRDGVLGAYRNQLNGIYLNKELKTDQNALLDTLLHEIQHAIQDKEGFTGGTNPGYWNRRLESGFDGRTASQKNRSAQLAEKYNQLKSANPQLMEAVEELEAAKPTTSRGEVNWDTLEQITPDPPEWERYDAKRDEIYEKYGDRIYEYMETVSQAKAIQGENGRTPTQLYWNTAGEIEARDTTARRRMSAEERKNTPPKLGDADTVFADGSGVSMAYDSNDAARFNPEGKTQDELLHDIMDSAEPFDQRYLYFGRFTDSFRTAMEKAGVEVKNLPVIMSYRDAYLAMESRENGRYQGQDINYHNLGIEGMKSAMENIGKPDAVMKSKRDGKIELFLDFVDYKGNRGLAIVQLDSNAQHAQEFIRANIVTSIYGKRRGDAYLEKAKSEGRLVYSKEEGPAQGITQVQYESNINAKPSSTATIRSDTGNSQEKSSGRASVEVSSFNNRTAAEVKREYERRMREYQEATRRDDPNFPYRTEMEWLRAAEAWFKKLDGGKPRHRTVSNTKRDIMKLFNTDAANRTDVERILNRNIGEMMTEGEIREDALDTIVNELLQTGTVVSSSKNSPWIDETYENIRKDLKGDKLYVSKDMWRDFSKDEARELRERARAAGITLADNKRYTTPDVRNMELAEKYGEEIFPTDISASDMLRNIVYCAEQGANEKQTLADRLWDEARQEGLGEAREKAYSRMVNDLRDKTEVILREFAEDNNLKLKDRIKTEERPMSYFDTKKAPAKEYDRKKGDYSIIGEIGSYTKEIAELENALETENRYVISEGEAKYEARIEEENGVLYASVWKNGEMIASASSRKRKNLPNWAAMEIRKDVGAQIMFHPGLENRGESYNADLKAAEEAGYPMFEKKNGEKVQTVPFWTWVKSKEYGNYGLVIDKTNAQDANGNPLVFAYYFNKKKGTGKAVMESKDTVYVVDGKYSDRDAKAKEISRMKDEESEAMRAEEREALWKETQKGSPFEAQPNATTDSRERVTRPTSAGVERLFQQLISKGKTEVSAQGEAGAKTYTAKMNTNGVEYWVDISDGRQDVQRFREFEKEKAAQLAAEWMDTEANRAYTAANEKRAEARRTEKALEENARIANEMLTSETRRIAEEAVSPRETAESHVADEIAKAEKSFRENLADVTHGAMRMFVNAGETVRRISKQTKNKSLEGYYFNAGAYSQRAGNWIAKGGSRTDISGHKTGESLMDILGNIMKTPEKYKDFQLMLLHRNNVDRMRYDNREELENLTKCVAKIEELYPRLKGMDNEYIMQTAYSQDSEEMQSREWKENVLDELLRDLPPDDLDMGNISEAAQMLIFTRQKISEARKNGLKPVFGYEVTAYDSQLEAERLLKENPEFDALAKKVYAYFDDLLQYRIDAGLDTQKHVDAMKKRYPNYVPTLRVEGTTGKAARRARRNGGIVVSNAIGRAIGGDAVIMPLHTAMSRKTVAVMKNAGLNQFGEQLVQSWNKDKSIPGVNKVEMVDYSSTDQYVDSEELYAPITNNTFSVLRGNDRYNITMDEGLAQAMNAFQPDKYANSDVAKLLKKGNDLFKALCTGYNPIFMVRNLVRDAQDAAFYSTDSATWAKMFPSAWKQIVTNGEIWQQYKALGGSYSSMLDYTTGLVKEPTSAAGKLVAKYETLGQAIEAAPRLAEFMTILANKGGSKTTNGVKTGKFTQSDLMEAMLGAADITTNFARGGTVTKMLNKYLVPFLNPSVQGADKFVRNITDRKGFKAWASLAIKAAALGILPELLNGLLYRDDDEWDDIPDQTKSNYYLFKLGNGYWLKIPRGRALAVFSAGATYAQEKAKGNDPKFSDVIEVVKSNVAPTDIFNQNIATAWTQTKLTNPDNPGTTWYGGNIESDRLQNYRPEDRYDEKTDELSKAIGKLFKVSPKKVNYLLDQYSGVIGDLLLPWLTPSATASSPALAPLKQAFMLDTTSTNKTTGEYYDLLDDLKYDANDGDIGAGITRKYVSHAGDEVNDYYAQIRELQNDKELSKAEKNRLVRALKSQLIERQKEIITQAEPYREAVDKYLKAHPELSTDNDAAIAEYAEQYEITEDQAESRMDAIVYREANREAFGAEYALRTYNADVYDKARTAYAKGVSYETYYDYYFATKEMHADKDENGKSISGSKKAKVVEYINSLDIPAEQKDALYVAAGYTEKSARYQKWNGGSGGSGGRGSGKRTTLKAPAPKAGKIIIPEAGSTAKSGSTSKTAKASGNVIADFTQKVSGTDIRKAATQAKRKALKVGNRTVYVEEGSPIDYFLKYGKLPSTK